jgi:hypothetical protein
MPYSPRHSEGGIENTEPPLVKISLDECHGNRADKLDMFSETIING